MILINIYNIFYRVSNEVNLFVPLGIVIAFTVLLIIFLKLRKLINPLKRAKLLKERGNNVKALVYIDLFLEKNPGNKDGLFLKADIETNLDLNPEAEGDYFKILYTKITGDGIDTNEIKKRILKPLYEQDKVYQTFELAKDILSHERNSAEALFYLSLIYMGQFYFWEADKILKRLTLNRPKMPEAFFIQSINYAQLRMFNDAMLAVNRAMEFKEIPVYHMIKASICYFDENYNLARDELSKMPNTKSSYSTTKQYIFYLKLNAMTNYKLRYFDRSALMFKMALSQVNKDKQLPKKENISKPIGKKGAVYGENGKLKVIKSSDITRERTGNPVEEYEKKMGIRKNISPEIEEYLKLKEVAIEEGKTKLIVKRNVNDPFQILDIDGLTDKNWIYMSYGLTLIKGGKYEEAKGFFLKMRNDHPEIIGLKRFIDLIDEKIEDSKVDKVDLEYIRKKSEVLLDKKKKRYEMWEYIEEWEKRIIRPFELIEASGYSTKKKLNPMILFKKDTKFTLDF